MESWDEKQRIKEDSMERGWLNTHIGMLCPQCGASCLTRTIPLHEDYHSAIDDLATILERMT